MPISRELDSPVTSKGLPLGCLTLIMLMSPPSGKARTYRPNRYTSLPWCLFHTFAPPFHAKNHVLSPPQNDGSWRVGAVCLLLCGAPPSIQCGMEKSHVLVAICSKYLQRMQMVFICPCKLHFAFLPILNLKKYSDITFIWRYNQFSNCLCYKIGYSSLIPLHQMLALVFLAWLDFTFVCFSGHFSVISDSKLWV